MSDEKVHFSRIGELPVMICVVEGVDEGRYTVGFSVSSLEKFDEQVARIFAERKARERLAAHAEWRARA